MDLHLNNEVFRELIELAADYFSYEQSHVEKDYWVCKILKELALSDFASSVYLKGGTSLSKAYGIINRFSEDLDIFTFSGNVTSSKQSEKTLVRSISHFVIKNNKDIYREELSITGGDFRKLAFSYDIHYESAGLKENLEVEIKCCTLVDKSIMYYPTQKRMVASIITEYLIMNERQDIIEQFALDAFEVPTIDPKRTLCDKISRLTRLSYSENFEILIAKYIRDVYDIYRILNTREYIDFIRSEEFTAALTHVMHEDNLFRNSKISNPVSEARIFARTEETLRLPAISRAYYDELRKLIFDFTKMPALEDVIKTMALLQEPLHRFDKKNYRI